MLADPSYFSSIFPENYEFLLEGGFVLLVLDDDVWTNDFFDAKIFVPDLERRVVAMGEIEGSEFESIPFDMVLSDLPSKRLSSRSWISNAETMSFNDVLDKVAAGYGKSLVWIAKKPSFEFSRKWYEDTYEKIKSRKRAASIRIWTMEKWITRADLRLLR